jgi:hypothetical protein
MTSIPETAAEFLRSRAHWLRVETVDRPGGGWDVVLRIDGTYSSRNFCTDDRADMVQHFQERLLEVCRAEGIQPRQLKDWTRPVERNRP